MERTPFFFPWAPSFRIIRAPAWALGSLSLGPSSLAAIEKGRWAFHICWHDRVLCARIHLSKDWVAILINSVCIMLRMINKSIFIYSGQDTSSEPSSTNQAGHPCAQRVLAGARIYSQGHPIERRPSQDTSCLMPHAGSLLSTRTPLWSSALSLGVCKKQILN